MEAYQLYEKFEKKKEYYDKRSKIPKESYFQKLSESTTLYVGGLFFLTTEAKINAAISGIVPIKNVILGLHKKTFKPCGFAFLEFFDRDSAELAYKYFNNAIFDGKKLKLDFDIGFKEGRQYGRGFSGGQVVDEYKTNLNYQNNLRHSHHKDHY